MNGRAKTVYSDSLCVLFMIYDGPCSSHELINFIYLLLFFNRKLKKSSAAFRTEFSLTFTYFLTGYICTLYSRLRSCHGLASHADVLRLVTRSSPQTPAQQTGHLAFVLKEPIRCYVNVHTSVVCHMLMQCLGSYCKIFSFEGQNLENKNFSVKCSLLAFFIVVLVTRTTENRSSHSSLTMIERMLLLITHTSYLSVSGFSSEMP